MNRMKKKVLFKGEQLDKLTKHLQLLHKNKIQYIVSSRGTKEEFEVVVIW